MEYPEDSFQNDEPAPEFSKLQKRDFESQVSNLVKELNELKRKKDTRADSLELENQELTDKEITLLRVFESDSCRTRLNSLRRKSNIVNQYFIEISSCYESPEYYI